MKLQKKIRRVIGFPLEDDKTNKSRRLAKGAIKNGDYDKLTNKESMEVGWKYGSYSEEYNEVKGIVRSMVGRTFDDIYANICRRTNKRSYQGQKIREIVSHGWFRNIEWATNELDTKSHYSWRSLPPNMIGAILNKKPEIKYVRTQKEITNIELKGRHYEKRNGIWFQQIKENRWIQIWDGSVVQSESNIYRQLNSKQLSKLDLKNS